MSIETFTSASTGEGDKSWDDGFIDGELAAISGLSARRALARHEMANDHDPMYAAAYWESYARTCDYLDLLRQNAANSTESKGTAR
ncbi:hypothetical protein [Streptomyces sp. NBC_01353]|uniref:hypothetical protein n=1 Tax=Streptomyces sp. NBC_01353 TaxID=2903835 RepID=UPI002E34FBC5|nr:hypothetical protein [Streptomyces sp. NBC_01353]